VLSNGGAGLVGSVVLRRLLADSDSLLFNLDKLGYASDLTSTGKDPRHQLLLVGLADPAATFELRQADPDLVKYLATESYLDRPIDLALPFPDAIIQNDWWLALVAARCGVITSDSKSFVLYRQHAINLIGATAVGVAFTANRFKKIMRGDALSVFLGAKCSLQILALHQKLSGPAPASAEFAASPKLSRLKILLAVNCVNTALCASYYLCS
jgi:hypothetical protein